MDWQGHHYLVHETPTGHWHHPSWTRTWHHLSDLVLEGYTFLLSRLNLEVVLTGKVSGNIHSCLQNLKLLAEIPLYLDTSGLVLFSWNTMPSLQPTFQGIWLYITSFYIYRFFYMWQVWLSYHMGHVFLSGFQTIVCMPMPHWSPQTFLPLAGFKPGISGLVTWPVCNPFALTTMPMTHTFSSMWVS